MGKDACPFKRGTRSRTFGVTVGTDHERGSEQSLSELEALLEVEPVGGAR